MFSFLGFFTYLLLVCSFNYGGLIVLCISFYYSFSVYYYCYGLAHVVTLYLVYILGSLLYFLGGPSC